MESTIKGEPKEIAGLVLALQGPQIKECAEKVAQKLADGLTRQLSCISTPSYYAWYMAVCYGSSEPAPDEVWPTWEALTPTDS